MGCLPPFGAHLSAIEVLAASKNHGWVPPNAEYAEYWQASHWYKYPKQLAEFITILVLTPLGIAVTVLRFVVTKRSSRDPGLEDWMALSATLFISLTNLGSSSAIGILNGRSIDIEIAETPGDYEHMRKWNFASQYFYFAHALCVKLSVLALYYRIFRVRQDFRIWIFVIGACQTMLVMVACVLQAFQCQPTSSYWDLSVSGKCMAPGHFALIGETPNSLIDFAMVSLAIVMIRSLQLQQSTKVKLQFLFGLGFL
ncbi:hypothetical protein PG997_010540 [Apiospora hydei]|uniref:Rhodopsin domain-containing protein n=1 Tax=Apiospora hydei TaxID=1337664 RepID=A0ABR1VYF9_9PEZI